MENMEIWTWSMISYVSELPFVQDFFLIRQKGGTNRPSKSLTPSCLTADFSGYDCSIYEMMLPGYIWDDTTTQQHLVAHPHADPPNTFWAGIFSPPKHFARFGFFSGFQTRSHQVFRGYWMSRHHVFSMVECPATFLQHIFQTKSWTGKGCKTWCFFFLCWRLFLLLSTMVYHSYITFKPPFGRICLFQPPY